MVASSARSRARYPLHALLLVGGSGLLFLFNLAVGFLFMALVPPLIPVFVGILFAGGSLVGGALNYAQRVSIRGPAAMLQVRHDQEAASRTIAARAA